MSWSTSELRVRLAPLNRFKPSSKIFYWPFQGGTSFVDLLCFCSVLCLLCLCASVYMCFVVTCWERADLLAFVCGVFCEFVTFPLVSWVRCGTWLYRFLIFAPLLTLIALYEKCLFPCLRNEEKPDALSFFLGIFFSDNIRLFGIIWASLWEKLFWGVGGEGVSTKSVSNQSPQLKRLAWKLKFHLQQVYIWYFPKSKKKKALIRLRGCAGWSAPLLFTNPPRQGFSRRGPYYSCIYDPCNSEWTASYVFFCFVFLNSHRKFILFCWIVLHFICFTKRCLAN